MIISPSLIAMTEKEKDEQLANVLKDLRDSVERTARYVIIACYVLGVVCALTFISVLIIKGFGLI